jgi:hypothetical protein
VNLLTPRERIATPRHNVSHKLTVPSPLKGKPARVDYWIVSACLTLLHCENCKKARAHRVERIGSLLTWTCHRCGTIARQATARN